MNSAQFIDQKQCYLCQSQERHLERECGTLEGQFHLRWVRCQQCSLVYLDPRPSLHALTALYDSEVYWQGESGYRDYLGEELWRHKQAQSRAHWLLKKLQIFTPQEQPKVLEVGSAAGFFLAALQELDAAPSGLELSRQMVEISKHRTRNLLPVKQGLAEEAHYESESFDAVAAWGCDSNFHDPAVSFSRFAEWLKPNGLLALNYHEYDHWAQVIRGNFKANPNALYFLNQSHILTLLRRSGFELLSHKLEFQWTSLSSLYHHTKHSWLAPISRLKLADYPIRIPVPGAYRVLAQKKG